MQEADIEALDKSHAATITGEPTIKSLAADEGINSIAGTPYITRAPETSVADHPPAPAPPISWEQRAKELP